MWGLSLPDVLSYQGTADRRRRNHAASSYGAGGGGGGGGEQCPQCGAEFGDVGSLVAHVEAHHPEVTEAKHSRRDPPGNIDMLMFFVFRTYGSVVFGCKAALNWDDLLFSSSLCLL